MNALLRLALVAPLAHAAVVRQASNDTASAVVSEVSSVIDEISQTLEPEAKMRLLGPDPLLPYDPNTSPYCTWWYDNRGGISCEDMPVFWDITLAEWHRWNPSIATSCDNFVVGRSYCVEAFGHPGGGGATTTTVSSTTTVPPSTTTTPPGNGIETPQPIQPGMVNNCDAFHLVQSGNTCDTITRQYGLTIAQFVSWNTQIGGAACTGLWLDAWVCVSTTDHTPQPPVTTTAPGNGVETPQPIQPGMVTNCNRFHLVESGNTCDVITSRYGITIAQFITWNTQIGGAACTGLWANAYVCIGVIGGTTPPTTTTTTSAGNGIQTPSPIQSGMVTNCNRFHLVEAGQVCSDIIARYGITLSQFTTWNPAAGSSCTGLWANTYACVSIIGFTPPTTTTTGNGISTPTPIQSGMTPDCRRFHFVTTGQTCQTIATQYSITLSQFIRWNPAVGNSCTGMWANTYACIQGP